MIRSPRRAFADYGCCGCCLLPLTLPLVLVVGASEWLDKRRFDGRGESIPYTSFGLILAGIVALALVSSRRLGNHLESKDGKSLWKKPEPGDAE